tara:strand:+ start:269 stop:370 length:102 start_codon:yes stop_codon:yes gene_type:complete
MIGVNEEVIEGFAFGLIFVVGLWVGFFLINPAY